MKKYSLPVIHIRLLGIGSVSFGEYSLTATDSHSKKLWLLLSYMLLYRNREILQNELIDLLWEKEKSSNPVGALKTLMHRLRKLLDTLHYPEPLILPHHGSYAFNPAVPCHIDVEEFSALCREAEEQKGTVLQAERLKQALGIYKGNFLPEAKENRWIASLAAQYHALYLQSVHTLIELLLKQETYAEASNLCWKALSYAPYEENLHYYLIYSLYLSGSSQAALTQYNASRDLFLSRFSRLPSERFQELYKVISASHNGIETDLDLIGQDLSEPHSNGSFFCEYETFKEIYRLQCRIIKRTQASIYLCLITITPAPAREQLSQSMLQLKEVMLEFLRGCDIFSRYSELQYLLLIPSPNQHAIKMILDRISTQYHFLNPNNTIEYAIRQLEHAD
ncbi:MAG: bacterial transcriptional activator domain-containing protein [Lachnospiraceae bacterium]|nr:bacterial transcriptional activator domain-containing protein [Lachnospiraceae bacterium]